MNLHPDPSLTPVLSVLRLDPVSAEAAAADPQRSAAPVIVLVCSGEPTDDEPSQHLIRWLRSPARLAVAVLVGPIGPNAYSMALACDVVIMGASACLVVASGEPLWPADGLRQRLVQRVGTGGFLATLLDDEPIPASEALHRGLVDRVVPDDRLDDVVTVMATRAVDRGPDEVSELKALLAIASGPVHEGAGAERLGRLEADARRRLDPDADGAPHRDR